MRGFGTINEDVSLSKYVRFGENYQFQLRLETFNTLNRHNLGDPTTSMTSTQFGLITSVSGNRTAQITLVSTSRLPPGLHVHARRR